MPVANFSNSDGDRVGSHRDEPDQHGFCGRPPSNKANRQHGRWFHSPRPKNDAASHSAKTRTPPDHEGGVLGYNRTVIGYPDLKRHLRWPAAGARFNGLVCLPVVNGITDAQRFLAALSNRGTDHGPHLLARGIRPSRSGGSKYIRCTRREAFAKNLPYESSTGTSPNGFWH